MVEGDWILNLMRSIDFDDYESLSYFYNVLLKTGVIDKLKQAGINNGDTVSIYNIEFEFLE